MKNCVEELRKSMGLSQEKFARMMKVSRQTISAIETGKYNPSSESRLRRFFSIMMMPWLTEGKDAKVKTRKTGLWSARG